MGLAVLDESTHLPQTPTSHSEACNLLLLQDYVRNVSRAQLILEQTFASLQRTEILTGIFSEHDLRTLRTACQCLNSLRIREKPTGWNMGNGSHFAEEWEDLTCWQHVCWAKGGGWETTICCNSWWLSWFSPEIWGDPLGNQVQDVLWGTSKCGSHHSSIHIHE